jgi:hypothetical protein
LENVENDGKPFIEQEKKKVIILPPVLKEYI